MAILFIPSRLKKRDMVTNGKYTSAAIISQINFLIVGGKRLIILRKVSETAKAVLVIILYEEIIMI